MITDKKIIAELKTNLKKNIKRFEAEEKREEKETIEEIALKQSVEELFSKKDYKIKLKNGWVTVKPIK